MIIEGLMQNFIVYYSMPLEFKIYSQHWQFTNHLDQSAQPLNALNFHVDKTYLFEPNLQENETPCKHEYKL